MFAPLGVVLSLTLAVYFFRPGDSSVHCINKELYQHGKVIWKKDVEAKVVIMDGREPMETNNSPYKTVYVTTLSFHIAMKPFGIYHAARI